MHNDGTFCALLGSAGWLALLGLISTGCAAGRSWEVRLQRGSPLGVHSEPEFRSSRLRVLTYNVWGLPSWINGASPARHAAIALGPGQFVNVWNTHLQEGSPRVRSHQLTELLGWIEASDQGQLADIVGGDFNLVPGTGEFARLESGVGPSVSQLAGMPAFPTWDGGGLETQRAESIDHIFVRLKPRQEVVTVQVSRRFDGTAPGDRLSDHLGLEALITFHGPEVGATAALVSHRPARPIRVGDGGLP